MLRLSRLLSRSVGCAPARRRIGHGALVACLGSLFATGCSSESSNSGPPPVDEPEPIGTCTFERLEPTAGAGGVVQAGPVQVGTAEADLGLPVGSALGAYTARAAFFGSDGTPDRRYPRYSGAFGPSAGIETHPRVKALAITAGDETVLLVHVDVGAMYDGILFEVERRLGKDFAGKVILASSHTHSGPAHFSANTILQLGFGAFRQQSFETMVSAIVSTSQQALDARQPASIGIAHEPNFDPDNKVNRDRRGENDDLAGGGKDSDLFVLRADAQDGTPLAIVPILGMHPTILSSDNNLASTEAVGAVERALEERFDHPVLVMHLQQAAGDVSATGSGGIDCEGAKFCYDFARLEAVGRYAADPIIATWERAGSSMQDELEIEMLTRAIPLGPDLTTIQARGGTLRYLPYEEGRMPDGEILDSTGEVISPIDEFNVAFGAGLCGGDTGLGEGIPGAKDLEPAYASCSRIEQVFPLLQFAASYDWYFEDPLPVCASTRTVLSALRLGGHLLVTLPGEPVNPLVEKMRTMAPVARDAFIVLGYAQDHVGYIMDADDWLRGGYEPSINVWGPIEGEFIAESAMTLAALAVTPERENAANGVGRPLPGPFSDVPEPDPAPQAGTVPGSVPDELFLREGVELASAQPPSTVPRLELAHFVWIGDDPLTKTPMVTLQREVNGAFETVRRR
ncbi:MAG: neutral/alkaline non-lysosomal ceramidase N-terminal domain-containing protein, partial [Myxococcota bacterium]